MSMMMKSRFDLASSRALSRERSLLKIPNVDLPCSKSSMVRLSRTFLSCWPNEVLRHTRRTPSMPTNRTRPRIDREFIFFLWIMMTDRKLIHSKGNKK